MWIPARTWRVGRRQAPWQTGLLHPQMCGFSVLVLGFVGQGLLERIVAEVAPGSEVAPGCHGHRPQVGLRAGARPGSSAFRSCGRLSFPVPAVAFGALCDCPIPAPSYCLPVLCQLPSPGSKSPRQAWRTPGAGLPVQGWSLDTRFLLGTWQLSPSPSGYV